MLIRVGNLYKIYEEGHQSEVTALRGISLDMAHGEFVALMGPSGSGKSTLSNIIGCLDRPSKGTCFLEGVDTCQLSDADLSVIRNRKIGFIFQGFNLVSSLSAIKNVELPLLYARQKKEIRTKVATDLLESLGLAHRLHHLPTELSGGEQQRVAIARALSMNPSLLVADEPTGNLDSQSGLEVMKIFKQLNQKGTTILMVTHDPQIASCVRRIVRFKDGQIDSDR